MRSGPLPTPSPLLSPDVNAQRSPWWKRLLTPSDAPEPATRPERGGPSPPTQLTTMLAPRGVAVWEEPVPRGEVVRALVDRVVPNVPALTADEALRHLRERDALGSTSVGEGVDLPHARIEGVPRPVFAIGLTHAGLRRDEADAADDTEVVWLLLLPPGGSGLGPTAQVARACRDRVFRTALRNAQSTDAVRAALSRWELSHESAPALWSR